MTTCIIAEKPSVARDIARIVGATHLQDGFIEGKDYLVTWAFGHLITLALPEHYGLGTYKADELPILPQPFQLIVRQIRKEKSFEDDPTALKQLKVIRSCFERAEQIIVATDAGREGELIFRYIYTYLTCQKPFRRLWISSLTDKAIREGLAKLKPGEQYDALYLAGKARSEADWLVGINASRALSIARRGAYSLGRVQTPTLALVCRRFLEHQGFSSRPYWRLHATIEQDGILLKALCQERFEDKDLAQSVLKILSGQPHLKILSIERKCTETPPPLLFDLTTLQKEANRKHGFSADKTLSLAQALYEKKIISYPRTGSRYISEDVFETIPTLLHQLGITLSQPLNRHAVDDHRVTDHHALLPTGESPEGLSPEETMLYQMVLSRFIEAFAPNSEEERMQAELSDGTCRYSWRATRRLSLGWRAYSQDGGKDKVEATDDEEELLEQLPTLTEGEHLPLRHSEITEHQTKPKPLFTEASLLSAMEHAGRELTDAESRKAIAECGLGTPATRASIIETLILRELIRREKKTLIPTEKGLSVYQLVKDQELANAELTANWELTLSAIEAGKASAEDFALRIRSYTTDICHKLLALQAEAPAYPSYRCPLCAQDSVGIFAKIIKCRNETCDFHIFREICGVKLTEAHIKELLTSRRTSLVKGFQNKAGKKFNAHITLRGDGSTGFEFDSNSQPHRRR